VNVWDDPANPFDGAVTVPVGRVLSTVTLAAAVVTT
jgi:hypothetical protein